MKRILYVALLMFWATCPLLAQKKYDKALAKADAAYDYGDYEGAIKILENKFYNKVKKKLGVQNKYTPGYYLRTAQYKWALGVVVSFEQNIEKALNESKIVYGENTEAHILTMMNVADLYILYGNFIKARNLTEEVNDKYMSFEQKDKNIRARIDLLMAKVLWGQGYFQDAIRYVSERETYFMGRIVDKESFVDATGKLQSVKLSERELYQRNADYATILTYKAKILGDMGEIDEAWFAYEAARDWIVKSRALGKKSFEYITNQFSFANFKVANGLDIDLLGRGEHREEGYDYIHDILKKGFNESHFMAFDIYETLLLQYLKTGKMGRYRNMKSEYDRAIRKNFPRNSLHHINTSIVEFNAKLSKDKTNELEDRAKSVLANIQSLPKNHKKTIQVLEFLYRVSIKDLQFDHAKIYLEDIISIQKQLYGEDSPQFHLANIKLANFYVDYTNNLALAEEMYEKSFYQVVKKETTPLHPDYINTLNHLAALENQKDDFVKAQNILDEAMTVSLEKFRSEKDIEYAKELEHVARLQLNIGQYDLARENITKVLDIYKELKLKNDEYQVVHLIKALETFAVLLGIEGYFDEAEESIEEARDLLEDARTLEGYNQLSSLDKLAGLHVFLGNYSESKEILDQLIPEYEKLYGKQSGKLVESLINKGRVEMLLGDYATAETTSRHVNDLSVIIFGEKSTRTSATLQLMGELLINIGDYEKAKEHLLKSVEILEERFGRNHIDVALALSQYGLARFYNGDDFDEVEKIMTEARDIIGDKLSNMNPRYAEVSTNLAKVYIQSTKYTEAFAALSLSESIWLNITGRKGRRNNVKIGQINSLAGDLYYFQKNYIKAKEFYDKALDIYKRTLNKNHPEYVKVLTKLSKVYYMEGEGRQAKETMESALSSYEDFIKDYFKALSEREKAKFWNMIRPDFEFYNTLAIQYMNEDKDAVSKMYNNALLTKALLLNSSIKVRERILNSDDEELKAKYMDWLARKDFLTRALAMSDQQLVENNINPARLTQEVELLERELSNGSEAFGSTLEESKVTWENVRNTLKENEVALEMIRYRHFNHTFTDSIVYAVIYVQNIKSKPIPEVLLIKNGYDLENKLFRYYKNNIEFRMEDRLSYGNFWEPIVSKVGNLSTLYLSPDGVYNQINLEAIPTGDGKYVIDNSNIILVSNTKDIFLHSLKKAGPEKDALAMMFGNPIYYSSTTASNKISALPGTETEVRQLRKLLSDNGFNSDYFTKDEATEQQVKALLNPNVLHIATHGFFNPEIKQTSDMELNELTATNNPLLRTGLILTGGGDLLDKSAFNYNLENGILTAYEAMNLNLDQTDLVVLSACETGLGKLEIGEGVYGLQRAFMVAGAKTLIMSMFKVDDIATQKLMVNFYKKWLETGDKRKSFVDAKKELRTEYKEPIYWGAFIMMGLD